jgi:hypothetical protein
MLHKNGRKLGKSIKKPYVIIKNKIKIKIFFSIQGGPMNLSVFMMRLNKSHKNYIFLFNNYFAGPI